MDGRARADLQEENGVRDMVEILNAIRMHLGFDAVKVLTPKAEIRLRSGFDVELYFPLLSFFSLKAFVPIFLFKSSANWRS